MKTRMKVAIAAGMALAITGATFAFSACTPKETSLTDQQKIYQKYVSYAEAAGDEVLTYEQWLDSVKGKDGKNGEDGEDGSKWFLGTLTPSNDMGNDGDFYLNRSNFDIYIKDSGAWTLMGNIKGADGAQGPAGSNGTNGTNGENGLTPRIDGDTKHWFIGDTDTGVLAEGTGGAGGANQTNWYSGKSSPVSDESARNAVAGDFYLDTSSFDIYNYVVVPGTSGYSKGVSWQWLGNLKEANNNYIHQSFESISADSSVDISSLTNGWYTVYVNSNFITAVNIEGQTTTSTTVAFNLRSPSRTETTVVALINKDKNSKTLKFTGTNPETTDVSIEPYGGQLLTAVEGDTVQAVVFVLPKDTAAESLQNYPACYLNGNVEGKIKLTDSGSFSTKNKTIYNGTSSLGMMGAASQALEIDKTQPLYFVGYDADFVNKIIATTFKIELAE